MFGPGNDFSLLFLSVCVCVWVEERARGRGEGGEMEGRGRGEGGTFSRVFDETALTGFCPSTERESCLVVAATAITTFARGEWRGFTGL